MGSSRKHKDKDSDRSSRKKHKRSRSRSRDRDYESSSRDKDREKHSSSKRRRRHRSSSDDERSERSDKSSMKQMKQSKKEIKDEESGDEVVQTKSSGGEISMSIEETNRIRIKLGLKPLDVAKTEPTEEKSSIDDKAEIFVKTENMAQKKKTETLREKIAAQKEKRRIQKKLSAVKGLADSDSDEDASAWVSKNRKLVEEKRKAEEREKMLEEMDEEFGIGNLVEDEFSHIKSSVYSARNLSGLTVGHSQTSFKEGSSIILTLQDKEVLAENNDILENVNILDDERATKNITNKKKLASYRPYDEPEYDEYGELKKKELLDKYDEEIEGPKKDSFTLGNTGHYNMQKEHELKMMKAKLRQQKKSESLKLPQPIIASEFYTAEEMVQFKKPKKKIRKVRKKALRADDLEPLPGSTQDHGSRESKHTGKSSRRGDDLMPMDMEISIEPQEAAKQHANADLLDDGIVEEDQAELDLQTALNKARKLKQRANAKTGVEKVAEEVKETKTVEMPLAKGSAELASIVMNETAEFCRALGDIPTYGQSGNRDDEEDIMDLEQENVERLEPEEEEEEPRSAWNEVEIDDRPVDIEEQDEGPILEEEPVVGSGIAGALQLATQKGYLDKEIKKNAMSAKQAQLQATNYTIEDKNYEEEKSSGRRSERFISGPVSDFKEKNSYKPDIKLEYIDDNGRILSQKEAFRYLSHKFHGKGPGKIKTEKRVKKQEEDALLLQMSSTDTPLRTLSMLQDKQRETQSPFVVLSGGSKALQSNSLSKMK